MPAQTFQKKIPVVFHTTNDGNQKRKSTKLAWNWKPQRSAIKAIRLNDRVHQSETATNFSFATIAHLLFPFFLTGAVMMDVGVAISRINTAPSVFFKF